MTEYFWACTQTRNDNMTKTAEILLHTKWTYLTASPSLRSPSKSVKRKLVVCLFVCFLFVCLFVCLFVWLFSLRPGKVLRSWSKFVAILPKFFARKFHTFSQYITASQWDLGYFPLCQNFRKFRSKQERNASVQVEIFRKKRATSKVGPLWAVGPFRPKPAVPFS